MQENIRVTVDTRSPPLLASIPLPYGPKDCRLFGPYLPRVLHFQMKNIDIANKMAADKPPTTPATVPAELFFEVSPLPPLSESNGAPFVSRDGSEEEDEVLEAPSVGFGALVTTMIELVWKTVSGVFESDSSGCCVGLGVFFGLFPFEEDA